MSDSIPVDELAKMVKAGEDQNTMLNAADELFANCEASEVTLPSGRVVQVNAAKVKQLKQMTAFITEFLSSLDSAAIIGIITKVSDFQKEQIAAGESPYKLGTLDKVKEVIGSVNIVSTIMINGMDRLPTLVPLFTDMSAEDFEELDLDEGFLVAFHILGRNYAFFIQRCVPIIRAYFALLASKKLKQPKTN